MSLNVSVNANVNANALPAKVHMGFAALQRG
jgi:hypothetical protein